MLLLALAVASCSGYFSVWGLSQLFAGASTAVIVMASVLELGKVVTTTALHRYWSKLAKGLKIYLTISVCVLMIITSAGIYGFLSNAYQKTANKMEIHQGEIDVLNGKKNIFEVKIDDNKKIIDTKNKRIDQLTDLRNNQERRIDSAKSYRAKTQARSDIQTASNEIQKLSSDIDDLNTKNASLSDSISSYNTKVLDLNASSQVTGEVGPLKYIAALTGLPMAKVVNYLILLLIFVFDPLAIALILITNRVFELEGTNNPIEPKDNETKEELKNVLKEEKKPQEIKQTLEKYTEPVKIDYETTPPIKPTLNEVITKPVIEEIPEEMPDDDEGVNEEPIVSLTPEKAPQSIPVTPIKPSSGKVELQDIKEIKERDRGYSVPVPTPRKSNNMIERVGTNKITKNGDKNSFVFKRNK